jgi:hypothetical protein
MPVKPAERNATADSKVVRTNLYPYLAITSVEQESNKVRREEGDRKYQRKTL